MKKEDRKRIVAAGKLLGLGDSATLAEIKQAYRRMSKQHHPDLADRQETESSIAMHEITAAYQVLLNYCSTYRYSLVPGDAPEPDAEEWWFDRFGNDPLWGKG